MRALALILLVGCGSKAAAPPRADAAPGGTSQVVGTPRDGGLVEVDAAPIAARDVLEGRAAVEAMAGARRRDGGAALTGLRATGVGPFELGMTAAEVLPLLGGQPLRPRPAAPDQPERAFGRAFEAGVPWLEIEVVAGRVTSLRILARVAGALSDEGIGLNSSMGEAVVAHGAARAVTRAGKLQGWVLSDLPGVLVETTPPGTPPPADDAPDDAPDGGVADTARIRAMTILGPESLASDD